MPDSYAEAGRLGRAIMSARTALGLKRKDLAALAKLSYPYIAELENGTKTPSQRALESVAGALRLTPAELLARAEKMPVLDQTPALETDGLTDATEPSAQEPLPRSMPQSFMTVTPAQDETAQFADRVAARVTQRILSLLDEDIRRRLRIELPKIVREEIDRLRGDSW